MLQIVSTPPTRRGRRLSSPLHPLRTLLPPRPRRRWDPRGRGWGWGPPRPPCTPWAIPLAKISHSMKGRYTCFARSAQNRLGGGGLLCRRGAILGADLRPAPVEVVVILL